jgi:hypothetical protein
MEAARLAELTKARAAVSLPGECGANLMEDDRIDD